METNPLAPRGERTIDPVPTLVPVAAPTPAAAASSRPDQPSFPWSAQDPMAHRRLAAAAGTVTR